MKVLWLLCLVIGLARPAALALPAEDVIFHIQVFRGAWYEGQAPVFENVRILSEASHPGLSALRSMAGRTDEEAKAGLIRVLFDVLDLKSVDDLFSWTKVWRKTEQKLPGVRLSEAVETEDGVFLFSLSPKRLSEQKISLRLDVLKSKSPGDISVTPKVLPKEISAAWSAQHKREKLDELLDAEILMDRDAPVLIAIPFNEQAYFLFLRWNAGSGIPNIVSKVLPAYPMELREKGITGSVRLQVEIDAEGVVKGAKVTKSLHPFLDYAAVHALAKWRFEPVIHRGIPVSAVVDVAIDFDPRLWRVVDKDEERLSDILSFPQTVLGTILDKCAEYCAMLEASALDFICEETIRDLFVNFHTRESIEKSGIVLSFVSGIDDAVSSLHRSFVPFRDPKRTERNTYLCDYMLVKKAGTIESKRIILDKNQQKTPDRTHFLEEMRFSALAPYLVPVQILGRDSQGFFDYRFLGGERVKGKRCYLIEAFPRKGVFGGIEHAKIWVDAESFQVRMADIEGIPLEGYETILLETTEYNIKPRFRIRYTYGFEKKGLLFPVEVSVRVGYPSPFEYGKGLYLEKIQTDISYDNYKFFMVETGADIKK